jgi:hypothetical protein
VAGDGSPEGVGGRGPRTRSLSEQVGIAHHEYEGKREQCVCGHEFGNGDEEADRAHRGYSMVDVTRPKIWPDKARLAQLKEDNAEWPDVASKCDLSAEEWQAKSPEFIEQWSQTCLEGVQEDLGG